jgi:hypothetical protein
MSNRKLQVAVGNYFSNPKEIKKGVVQGAVLSVTMFLIAMADIVKEIKETCTILRYADDWVIVTSSQAPITTETRIKEAANSDTRWESDNGFRISSEKTITMLIHRRRPRNEGNTRFKRVLIGTEKVEMVKKNRILGLTFHERHWKEHIKYVNLLKSLSHTSWGSDQKTLLRIHQMIVLSTLRYGEEAYGSASCAVLRQLDENHHKGVRLALSTFAICRTENLLCEAGLAKLDEIRKLNSTKSAIRIVTDTGHPIIPYFMSPNKLDEYAM